MQLQSASENAAGRLRRLAYWISNRDLNYVFRRSLSLLQRYGIASSGGQHRVLEGVEFLASYSCYPTLLVPGRVVNRYRDFCAELQARGVELGVHGFDHVNFLSLEPAAARGQFLRAAQAFQNAGLRFDGFRCPYLGFNRAVLEAIPPAMFSYSSNEAIWWDTPSSECTEGNAVFRNLRRFYKAKTADQSLAVPRRTGGVLEIPVSVPDDLQLYDGLRLGEAGVAKAWMDILHRTFQRGDLFVLLFHPESFQVCQLAFGAVLNEAASLHPRVWMARLREVSEWWREKAAFHVSVSARHKGIIKIDFSCSERATILVRNVATESKTCRWEGGYEVLVGRTLSLKQDILPFIGLLPSVAPQTAEFLKDQGYIVREGDSARRCSIVLDQSRVAQLRTPIALVDFLESSIAPLVRFWRWPNAAKSAVSITGDLDALSLLDYLSRPFTM